jgi:RND family efflux transporter MFP subunit
MALQADAALRHAKATLRLLEEGTRAERVAKAKALVAVQTAEVERLSEQLDRHTMFAPFDGFVTKEHTEVGYWVMQGDAAAEIAEMSEVDVEIPVLENLVSGVALGETARVEVTAIPDCVFTGTVAVIVPQADSRARTFPVKVRLQNRIDERGPLLKVGMFARVTLSVGAPVKALLAPKDAIVLGGPTPLLYVIVPGADEKAPSTVKPVPVQLGVSSGESIQVIGDLKANQQVVVEGNERLRPGQAVQPQPRSKSAQQAKVREDGNAGTAATTDRTPASK